MGEENKDKIFEMLFMHMVMSLNEAAMVQLGKIVNPVSGKIERNLSQAQGTIELMRMLKVKTAGNLALQELQLLEQSVLQLELNFAEEKEAQGTGTDLDAETATEAEPDAAMDAAAVEEIMRDEEDIPLADDENASPGRRKGIDN